MIRHTPWDTPPYDFAIGLKTIPLESWLEGGDAEAPRKQALLASDPVKVWGEMEGSLEGQQEVLSLVIAATAQCRPQGRPLWAASLLCSDDLCLMERRNGAWTLTAASLCSPTFFTVEEALGKDLEAIHGPVPGFGERFLARVVRMFDALPDGPVLERRNWTVVGSGEAFLPASAPVCDGLAAIHPAEAGEKLFLRVERQTLRRLPQTGGVLFTIRAWRHPLQDLRADPAYLAAFEQAWRGADPAFRAYKGLAAYDALVEAFFRPRLELTPTGANLGVCWAPVLE